MKFYAEREAYDYAKKNGHSLEEEKQHAEVIYEYVREFCLNEQIRDYGGIPAKITVLLPDSDTVTCKFTKRHYDASIGTILYIGKPDIIDAYSISGKKLDKSIVRNISGTNYVAPIKEMFGEYEITAQFDEFRPEKHPQLIEI